LAKAYEAGLDLEIFVKEIAFVDKVSNEDRLFQQRLSAFYQCLYLL
jgi:hypothetical protein